MSILLQSLTTTCTLSYNSVVVMGVFTVYKNSALLLVGGTGVGPVVLAGGVVFLVTAAVSLSLGQCSLPS